MRAGCVNLRRAFADQSFGGFHQRAGGVDDVVDDQRAAAADVADQVHDFADVDVDAALIHDGQRRVEFFGKEARAFHAARIRRNDRQIRQLSHGESVRPVRASAYK